ncbi:MAG: lytic transglycosylase domain-containing protein [Neisseriaceae bacterium]|nr:lytic transglycosylase domain-containing protein [Neisseriaceae bacterium]
MLCLISQPILAKNVEALIQLHAKEQGLDANLVKAIIVVESSRNARAQSPKNALGLMQVMPATAMRMGVRPERLFEADANILAGTRYLAFLSKRFNGNLDLMLAGYNAGEGAVAKHRGVPPYRETINYVQRVKRQWVHLTGSNHEFDIKPRVMVEKAFWLGAPLSSFKDMPMAPKAR